MKSILAFSHDLLKEVIKEGDLAIDATVGNGNDTKLLAELVGQTGRVIGFDIQEEGLKRTQEKLSKTALDTRVSLLHKGHETVSEVLDEDDEIAAAIFNLGYLPKSDKSIITLPETTLEACRGILKQLKKGGRLVMVIYHGHVGGDEEREAVTQFFQDLPQEEFHVIRYGFINQINNPPFIVACERR